MKHGAKAFPTAVGTPRPNGHQALWNSSSHASKSLAFFYHSQPSFLSTHRFPRGQVLVTLGDVNFVLYFEEIVFLGGKAYIGDLCSQVIHLL